MPLSRFALPVLVLSAVGLTHPAHAIVAGDPNGSPPDSPANRIDPNTDASPFSGVVSYTTGSAICTGVLISPFHVLTAAHCVTNDSNGNLTANPANTTVNFNGDSLVTRGVSAITVEPTWDGFNNENVADLAILTLDTAAPAFADIYPIYTGPINAGDVFEFVGYGRTGDGVTGYGQGASTTQKRVGANSIDRDESVFGGDGDLAGVSELFVFDFDDATGNGFSGLGTLGNDIETTFGGGDSGGPAFFDDNGTLSLAGINAFVFGVTTNDPDDPLIPDNTTIAPPLFGSGGGGVILAPYTDFINGVIPEPASLLTLALLSLGLTPRRRPSRA